MNDNTVMSFGKYKGQKLANIPADYLIWLYRQKTNQELMKYIEENEEILLKESNKYHSLIEDFR